MEKEFYVWGIAPNQTEVHLNDKLADRSKKAVFFFSYGTPVAAKIGTSKWNLANFSKMFLKFQKRVYCHLIIKATTNGQTMTSGELNLNERRCCEAL